MGIKPKVASLHQGPRLAFQVAFNQRSCLLYTSGIRSIVGYNNSSKRSSVQVASNQRLRLFVKVQGLLSRWRSTKGCISSSRSSLAFSWLSVITTAAKGPLFKWHQTKGCVFSSRSKARFPGGVQPKVASPLQHLLWHSVDCRLL
jgi:hypothetical protein